MSEKQWIVFGVADREQAAKIIKARAEAERSKMELRPHKMYGAYVFRTYGSNPSATWACALFEPEGSKVEIDNLLATKGRILPCAYGSTPEAACKAFDHLWETGSDIDAEESS